MQTTVSKTVQLSGIGLHSGCRVKMSVLPAPADTGIVFRRVDLPGKPEIRALYTNVVNTQNCTCLGDADGNLVSTIEHVMLPCRFGVSITRLLKSIIRSFRLWTAAAKCSMMR